MSASSDHVPAIEIGLEDESGAQIPVKIDEPESGQSFPRADTKFCWTTISFDTAREESQRTGNFTGNSLFSGVDFWANVSRSNVLLSILCRTFVPTLSEQNKNQPQKSSSNFCCKLCLFTGVGDRVLKSKNKECGVSKSVKVSSVTWKKIGKKEKESSDVDQFSFRCGGIGV